MPNFKTADFVFGYKNASKFEEFGITMARYIHRFLVT
jgi:hypothetical protein